MLIDWDNMKVDTPLIMTRDCSCPCGTVMMAGCVVEFERTDDDNYIWVRTEWGSHVFTRDYFKLKSTSNYIKRNTNVCK